jgi:hypothetical protein
MSVRNVAGKMSKATFCSTFGVSEKQLERHCQNGMPHEKQGRRVHVLMPDGRVWLHRYIEEKGKQSAAPKTINDARLRKETAQAGMEELKLAREQGKTMLVIEHEKLLGDAFSRVRAKLLNLAPRAAGAGFGATSIQDCQAKIEPVITEIMEELCAGDDVPELADDDDSDRSHTAAD